MSVYTSHKLPATRCHFCKRVLNGLTVRRTLSRGSWIFVCWNGQRCAERIKKTKVKAA